MARWLDGAFRFDEYIYTIPCLIELKQILYPLFIIIVNFFFFFFRFQKFLNLQTR